MLGEKNNSAENTAASGKKIDKETAENEFIRFCDSNRIKHDESAMNDEELDTFKSIKDRFIENCMEGRVEVDGTSIKYTLSSFSGEGFRGEVIKIIRPAGQAMTATDGMKDRDSVKKLHAFMSAITGKDIGYFSKIDISDWKFLNSIAQLFLSL